MFHQDQEGVWRAAPLARIDWLVHGFGTRHSPAPPQLATLHQIHSNRVIAADARSGSLGDGDALITGRPGSVVGVKTADCMPILLVDERRRAVAAVHAGWRGTVAEIARCAVEELERVYGSRAEDLHAALGPAIGACCYEVGPEVAARFGLSGRVKLDLATSNSRQLTAAGVRHDRIYAANLCTMCGGDQFQSYRREKDRAGRMISYVGLR